MPTYLMGIDNGGTMAKAAVFTADGTELAAASCKSEMLDTHPGWAEFDMTATWTNTANAIKSVLAKANINPADIAAIACTGHGNGLYLVDENGLPIRNAIGSADGRAREFIEQWTADGTAARMLPKTTQAIWAAQPNALLRWLMDHEPESIDATRWVLMCKDYVRLRLTGEAYMELSDMSATSLMNVVTEEYEDDILDAWGLGALKDKLPPLKASGDLCGCITAAAAAETGLAVGTPVAGGMFDIDAMGLACGMVDESSMVMVGGSWGNNQYIAKEPVASNDVFMTSCYSIPGYYLMLEGSPTSASNLEWFVTELILTNPAERDAFEQTGQSVYDLCNELVAGTTPDDSGLIYLPFLYGSNVSLDGKACFIGLDGWQKRAHMLRAVYEGVIFSHFWHIERLLQFRTMPERILLTGGAARSSVWAQMFADILQTPVDIPAGTELGCLGAAICAAVAAGVHDSYETACKAMVSHSRSHEPNAELADVYKTKYARYRKMLEILQPHWADLAWKTE